MQVTILPFGILKESLGQAAFPLTLPKDATVSDLLASLGARTQLRGIAVSVNAEYAQPNHKLTEGDEVGLLPPVSGGTDPVVAVAEQDTIYLTNEVIPSDQLIAAAKAATDGAILTFDGIVRNHSRNRETLYLDYEAYEEMALKQLHQLAVEAREKFPIRHVTIVHRLGRLAVGETSVLILVASAHRAAAYEASRFLIDTLKKTVPIWKKETFTDGAVWADGDPFPESIVISPTEPQNAS